MSYQRTAHSGGDEEMRRNAELNREIVAAFNDDGMGGAAAFFDPDVVMHDPDLPGGKLHGRDAVLATFTELTSGFDSMEVRRLDMYPAGDRIVSLIHSVASGEGTRGEMQVEMRTAHVSSFSGGRVVDWQFFDNERDAFEAAGLDPAAPGAPFPEDG